MYILQISYTVTIVIQYTIYIYIHTIGCTNGIIMSRPSGSVSIHQRAGAWCLASCGSLMSCLLRVKQRDLKEAEEVRMRKDASSKLMCGCMWLPLDLSSLEGSISQPSWLHFHCNDMQACMHHVNLVIFSNASLGCNVGIAIINHPPVITIDSWYPHHSQSWVVYYCYISYTHIMKFHPCLGCQDDRSPASRKPLSRVAVVVWVVAWCHDSRADEGRCGCTVVHQCTQGACWFWL